MRETYSKKLLNPKWQRKRLEILSRSDFHCDECGDGENALHVHHKHYIKGREPWEYEDHELMALCEKCHTAAHSGFSSLNMIQIMYVLITFPHLALEINQQERSKLSSIGNSALDTLLLACDEQIVSPAIVCERCLRSEDGEFFSVLIRQWLDIPETEKTRALYLLRASISNMRTFYVNPTVGKTRNN